MPNASAPNAPCVEVCESPQTIVMPGLREPELGADHVDDALAAAAGRVERDAELLAVPRAAPRAAARRADRRSARRRRVGDVVVHRRERQVGPPHAPAGEAQALERLRRGDLVDEVQVDVEQRRLAGGSRTTCASQTFSNSVLGTAPSYPAAAPMVPSVK